MRSTSSTAISNGCAAADAQQPRREPRTARRCARRASSRSRAARAGCVRPSSGRRASARVEQRADQRRSSRAACTRGFRQRVDQLLGERARDRERAGAVAPLAPARSTTAPSSLASSTNASSMRERPSPASACDQHAAAAAAQRALHAPRNAASTSSRPTITGVGQIRLRHAQRLVALRCRRSPPGAASPRTRCAGAARARG